MFLMVGLSGCDEQPYIDDMNSILDIFQNMLTRLDNDLPEIEQELDSLDTVGKSNNQAENAASEEGKSEDAKEKEETSDGETNTENSSSTLSHWDSKTQAALKEAYATDVWRDYSNATFTSDYPEQTDISIPNTDAYLVKGVEFFKAIPYVKTDYTAGGESATVQNIVFTDKVPDKNTSMVDLSEAKDGAVVGWVEGATWYVSSRRSGVPVYANKDCSYMFGRYARYSYADCTKKEYSFKTLDFSNLNTSRVTNMTHMFNYIFDTRELDLSNFDTHNVTNMSYMFSNCIDLIALDISAFDTSNVTTMKDMFDNCNSVLTLDTSRFNTAKVETVENMFANCSSLESIDISSFDTSKMKTMWLWFAECTSLKTIYVNENPSTASLPLSNKYSSSYKDIFMDCRSLQGAVKYDKTAYGEDVDCLTLDRYLTKK